MTHASPVFRFTPNRDFVSLARIGISSWPTASRVNNAGFVDDQDYRKDDPLPLLAVVGELP